MGSILFIIVPIFIGFCFIFTFVMMFSSKARGKMMSKQIKAARYMMDESKEDIKSISDDMADATKDSIKVTTSSFASGIREGLNGEESMYCKHCGNVIDSDSTFCKKCGKKQ